MDSPTLIATGALITAAVAGYIALRTYLANQKKADSTSVEEGYKKLQTTYLAENERLNVELGKERNERNADKLACQNQIAHLQTQLTALLTKLPEPGATVPVVIAAIAPALEVPVVVKGPLPMPMSAVVAAAAAAASAEADKESKT